MKVQHRTKMLEVQTPEHVRPVRDCLEHSGLGDDGGVLEDVEAELATLLSRVKLVLAGRRREHEVLDEAADGDAEDGQREDDAGAAPAADAEGQVPEVVAVGLHVLLLLQEALRPELVGPLPLLGVVGEEPGVDEDLALGGDVVAGELGVVEVHVGHQQRDGHAQPQRLLDHRLQVGELVRVRLRDLVPDAQHRVHLVPQLLLDLRVVHQLRQPPLDRPQRRLDRCMVHRQHVRDHFQQPINSTLIARHSFTDMVVHCRRSDRPPRGRPPGRDGAKSTRANRRPLWESGAC
uniref:Uncharacterized protein n=1 Tax=Triticum urartu TaxID=4572 RepID=A0A8R7TYD6_TRIUA